MKLRKMMLNINGVDRMFMCDPENDKLSDVLRRIGLTGVKVGCGTGVCGSCSIILNGPVIRSCTKKINQVEEYSKITTIEGIGTPQHLHPLQVAWMNCGAVPVSYTHLDVYKRQRFKRFRIRRICWKVSWRCA